METTIRIRTSIGDHEFEAEGPSEQVQAEFAAWRELVKMALGSPPARPADPLSGQKENPGSSEGLTADQLAHVFAADEKRSLVTLRALPRGDGRHAQGVLLVLYGFRQLRGDDEVLVTRIKAALEASGSVPDRIDRAALPLLQSQLAVKSGAGKGGRYRLTNRGVQEAEKIVRELVEQLS